MGLIYNYLDDDPPPVPATLETPGFSLSICPVFRFLDCSTKIIEFAVDLSVAEIPLRDLYDSTPIAQFHFKIFTGFQSICLEQFIDFFSRNSHLDPILYLNRDCEDNHFEDSICNMDYKLIVTLTFPFGEKKDCYEFNIGVTLNIGKGMSDNVVKVSLESVVSNKNCLMFSKQLNEFKKYFDML
jgi:hypothetical protein